MKTISIRDLRQRWPEAEALLQTEREIVITRDAKPVAKLVRIDARVKPRSGSTGCAWAVGSARRPAARSRAGSIGR